MGNPPVLTLFGAAVRETREDLEEVASRFVGRINELTAHTSGALAGRVDELGERLSSGVDDVVGRLSAQVADRVVELGETLTGSARDRATDGPGEA